MTQMLLPHESHRSFCLADILNEYQKTPFLINENSSASLGAIGTVGLLLLLAIVLFYPFLGFQIDDRIQLLSFLSVFYFCLLPSAGFHLFLTHLSRL